ncbi:hypothetical protein TcasGA2_TC031534 [Tribolium castaneum]|nr:hypothetical protein TcasGA2_TC031534 [Tribolium castaneum]
MRQFAEPLARIHDTTSQVTSALPPPLPDSAPPAPTLTSATIDSREQNSNGAELATQLPSTPQSLCL